MRSRFAKLLSVLMILTALASLFVIRAAAIDDTYSFDSLGMSVKLPKSCYVITRDTPRDDEVFSKVNLDYDETMTAFRTANIYLIAYDSEIKLQLSLTVTEDADSKDVNNYSDLTAAERKALADKMLSNPEVSSAVEVKHNGNIFFDLQRSAEDGGDTVYINQSNTVINGKYIDLVLKKTGEEITPEEAKLLTNAANSLSFDNIKRNTGPVFDLWRLALWVGILAALSVAVSVIYKSQSAANKRRLEERRAKRAAAAEKRQAAENGEKSEGENGEKDTQMTFEESLGYMYEEEFKARSEADELAGSDISVRERDPSKGIVYFEDKGYGIDDGSDYFDTYFKEPTEKRSPLRRFFGTIGAYLKIAVNHTGYFFKNLFRKIFGGNNKKD